MNKNKKPITVAVIGAGVAGMSAAIYAQKSGFDVTLYEAHSVPGGNCTAWQRGGYLFDSSMHWLNGSKEGTPVNRLWRETGAIRDDIQIYNSESSLTCGNVSFYRDLNRLQSHLLEISPQDKKAINSLCSDIKKFSRVFMPVLNKFGVKSQKKSPPFFRHAIKMLPALIRIPFLSRISVKTYSKRFKNSNIRSILIHSVNKNFDVVSLMFTLGAFAAGDGGYVEGGSKQLAKNMAACFVKSGGKLCLNTTVDKVNDLERTLTVNGAKINYDAVVVASDALSAIDTLFDSKIKTKWAEKMRKNITPLLCTFLCFGVKKDLSDYPEGIILDLKTPISFAGFTWTSIKLNNYGMYAPYAPAGCASLTLILSGDSYDFWNDAKKSGKYEEIKEQLACGVFACIVENMPELAGTLSVWDVATPLTYEKFCRTYRGSWMSMRYPRRSALVFPHRSKNGLYFAGHRMQTPGGLIVALASGYNAAQYLCRDFKMEFKSV
ncbi:MAG: FAD-dependent oxidoreductase [Termitinemataceae bacterium]|nr:MAG: FAD-dependent oxidoreductase [Termitinemataceae bacterium]